MRARHSKRPAFTIVEMLIAIALTLVVMLIIAQAFASATKTFSTLRTAGQLQERTRGAASVIRRDLTAEHFDGPYLSGLSGPRVGDQRLDRPGWFPPPKGYFEIRQFPNTLGLPFYPDPLNAPGITDAEGLPSTRADTHILRFTVRLPDLPAPELFCAEMQPNPTAPTEPYSGDRRINGFPIPGNPVVYSRWAEVQYWLEPNGDATPATANGPSLPLYSLRRRVRLLAPAGVTYVVANQQRAIALMVAYPDLAMYDMGPVPNGNGAEFLRVLGPDDVTNPVFRMPYRQPSIRIDNTGNAYPTGDDILLTDVLSFEVRAAWFANAGFEQILPNSSPNVRALLAGNTDEPFDDLPPSTLNNHPNYAGQRIFDTWYRDPNADSLDWDRPLQSTTGAPGFLTRNQLQVPLRVNVRALQIRLRVWDGRKDAARQMTIVQEI